MVRDFGTGVVSSGLQQLRFTLGAGGHSQKLQAQKRSQQRAPKSSDFRDSNRPPGPAGRSNDSLPEGPLWVPPKVWQHIRERFDKLQKTIDQEHQQVLAILEGNGNVNVNVPVVDKRLTFQIPDVSPSVHEAPPMMPPQPPSGEYSVEVREGWSSMPMRLSSDSYTSQTSRSSDYGVLQDFDDDTHAASTTVVPFKHGDRLSVNHEESIHSQQMKPVSPQGSRKGVFKHYALRQVWRGSRFIYHDGIVGVEGAEAFVHPVASSDSAQPHIDIDGEAIVVQDCASKIIMHPNCYKRSTWDLSSMGMVLYDVVMIPFSFFDPELNLFLKFMAWMTRLFWTIDLVFSFTSGYITQSGDIEMRPAHIARRYLRTWFGLDTIIVVSDWVELFVASVSGGAGMARMGKATRVFRVLRMLRLLRMAKANAIMSLIAGKIASEEIMIWLDVFKLVVIMVSAAHFVACGFYAVGVDNTEVRNWPDLFGYSDLSLRYRYIMSLRWGLSQFAGGMDEVQPVSFSEHCYSAVVFLFAFWVGSAILSYLTSHVMHLDHLATHDSHQISQINTYLKQQSISKGLSFRVIRKAKHMLRMRRQRVSEQVCGINDLVSLNLLEEVHFEMYWPLLNTHNFFKEFVTYNAHVVKRICHDAMSSHVDAIGDTIFHVGENAKAMIIIVGGQVCYAGQGVDELVCCFAGTWFSEAVLWTTWAHHGTLTAVEDSQCTHLSAVAFAKILSAFEIVKFDVVGYASGFLQKLNNLEGPATDLPVVTNEPTRVESTSDPTRDSTHQDRPSMDFKSRAHQSTMRLKSNIGHLVSRSKSRLMGNNAFQASSKTLPHHSRMVKTKISPLGRASSDSSGVVPCAPIREEDEDE